MTDPDELRLPGRPPNEPPPTGRPPNESASGLPAARRGEIALVGTTASGKSALALAIARTQPDVELVSVDSMQVYRGMDIGTAKPTAAEQAEVRHHLIDVADPDEEYAVARFADDVRMVRADLAERGKRALFVGGTGLYLSAVIDQLEVPGQFPDVRARLDAEPDTAALHGRLAALDPVAAERMEPTNRRRIVRALEVTEGSGRAFSSYGPGLTAYPPTAVTLIGIRLPRPVVDARIAERYRAQLDAGFLDEIRALAARPEGLSRTAAQALGYKELLAHAAGEVPLEEALETAIVRTRRFARRQERWFRRDPRIEWFEPPDDDPDPMRVLPDILAHLDA